LEIGAMKKMFCHLCFSVVARAESFRVKEKYVAAQLAMVSEHLLRTEKGLMCIEERTTVHVHRAL
jgi:hypothetical protein